MNAQEYEDEDVYLFGLIVSILSLLGCLFMMLSYWFVYELRRLPAYKLIFNLALADFLLTLNGLFTIQFPSPTLNDNFCYIWGIYRQYAMIASFCWPFLFGHVLFAFYHGRFRSSRDIHNRFYLITLFGWGLPILFTIIPIFFDAYGDAHFYCWLDEEKFLRDPDVWVYLVFGCFYIPIFLLGLIVSFYYFKIIVSVCRTRKEERPPLLELLFYPGLFLIRVALTAVDRFWDLNNTRDIYWMFTSHLILGQAQGFLNFVAYGMSERVRNAIKKSWQGESGTSSTRTNSGGLNISLQEITILPSGRTPSTNSSFIFPSQRHSY